MYTTWVQKIVTLSIIHGSCYAMTLQPKNNPFDALSKKAEEKYRTTGITEDAPEAQKTTDKNVQQNDQQKKLDMINSTLSSERPILAKHKEFSNDWWNTLLGTCNACDHINKNLHNIFAKKPKIDCNQLLKNNPQWQEVEHMPRKAKRIVMQTVMDNYYYNKINSECALACAICAGSDPNERLADNSMPHTALHIVSDDWIIDRKPHYPLFLLLLEKGADPNMECETCCATSKLYPMEYVPREWKADLKKYGVREL